MPEKTLTTVAFALLCAAAAIGCGLLVYFLREPGSRAPPRAIPALHGLIGTASLAVLLTAIQHHPPTPHGMGTQGFGRLAALLLALVFLLGLSFVGRSWRRQRPRGVLVGTHAGLAIAAFVVLLALIVLR
jgi:hypothetical protein